MKIFLSNLSLVIIIKYLAFVIAQLLCVKKNKYYTGLLVVKNHSALTERLNKKIKAVRWHDMTRFKVTNSDKVG